MGGDLEENSLIYMAAPRGHRLKPDESPGKLL